MKRVEILSGGKMSSTAWRASTAAVKSFDFVARSRGCRFIKLQGWPGHPGVSGAFHLLPSAVASSSRDMLRNRDCLRA